MLSTSHNFLFIHVPKTAGNSIQDALRLYSADSIVCPTSEHDGVERFGVASETYNTKKHSTFSEYQREYGPELMGRLFKFSCARNPWQRCMSHYFSPHRGTVTWKKKAFRDLVKREVLPLAHYWSAGDSVQPLVVAVRNIDLVIRHDHIDEDFATLCERVGLPEAKLARRNASAQPDYLKYYDDDSIAFVEKYFAEEIEYFGYSLESAVIRPDI